MTTDWRETQVFPSADPDKILENCEQIRAGWRCPACGLEREKDFGPDPCLGELPGVNFACCGHAGMADTDQGYIAFSNGRVVRFSPCRVDGVEIKKEIA